MTSPIALPTLAVIDLDGTLVDTIPDIAYSVDETLARLGLPRRGEARVRQWVGNGIEALISRALSDGSEREPDEALHARAVAIFSELYAGNTSRRSRAYPGVDEGLAFLHSAGVELACVTNKAARFSEKILTDLGLRRHFSLVVSGDTLEKKKPDPQPLLHAAGHFGIDPSESLFIGDSSVDVSAARAAGFGIVCVTYGYNFGNDIRASRPDAVIDSLAELDTLFVGVEPRESPRSRSTAV
jgi:phosphoglycolate phosphatase